MKVLRVKELADILQTKVNEGLGDRIVLIPDTTLDAPTDYRTICAVDTNDRTNSCLYLEINGDEEEETFWNNKCQEY